MPVGGSEEIERLTDRDIERLQGEKENNMPSHKHIDPEKVKELHAQKLGATEISKRLGCRGTTIWYHLKKLGLQPNKSARRNDGQPKTTTTVRRRAAAIEAKLSGNIGEDAPTIIASAYLCDAIWANLPLEKKAALINRLGDVPQ